MALYDDSMDASLRLDDSYIDISYSEVKIESPESVDLVVGDRSVDLFLNPNHFPVKLHGDNINLNMKYEDDGEKMTVQRVESDGSLYLNRQQNYVLEEESLDVYGLTRRQKAIAFLYLVGVVSGGN